MRTGFAGLVGAILLVVGAGFAAPGLALQEAAAAEAVDLQLILTADVSRSIDMDEFKLQREGYASALKDPQVLRAIQAGVRGAIEVCFIEWSSVGEQKVVVDWTIIRDDESAGVVADQILTAPRSYVGHTSISDALDFAVQHFTTANAVSPRKVIDVSGDGTNNSGRSIQEARDAAVALGITINGLAIINLNPNFGYTAHTQPPGGLPSYYRENVTGGQGSFVLQIEDFHSFSDAMVQKLVTEISGAPAPSTRDYAVR